jgi:nucleotide-binding universal stress UspA family protein
VRIIVTTGRAGQTILALARPEKIDLIVMSSHGYTGFKCLVLGSVTQQIERHSQVPVLILRDQAALAGEHLGDTRPVRVIAALDGSAYAETILPAAVELSKTLSSPKAGMLHLAMVILERGQGTDRTNDEYNKAQGYLTMLSQNLRKEQVQLTYTTSISAQSNVRDALVELAERGGQTEDVGTFTGYDLIAMTTHGREGIERMLRTSVAEQVLDAAQVPLLIIHSTQELEPEQPASEMEIFAGPIGLL